MKAPSRRMAPASPERKATFASWAFLIVMLAGLGWGLAISAPFRWSFGAYAGLMLVLSLIIRRRTKRIREERREESICTFARTLPARAHDNWVVRAVYEELSARAHAPVRPGDDLKRLCGLDGDELDDLAFRVARRANRSMASVRDNPMFDRVTTVADMIRFFEYQPKLGARPSEASA